MSKISGIILTEPPAGVNQYGEVMDSIIIRVYWETPEDPSGSAISYAFNTDTILNFDKTRVVDLTDPSSIVAFLNEYALGVVNIRFEDVNRVALESTKYNSDGVTVFGREWEIRHGHRFKTFGHGSWSDVGLEKIETPEFKSIW